MLIPSHQSFDIFDTVLTRRLSRPVDVFSLLETRLREEGIRTAPYGKFRALRIRCERWSRRLEPSYEVLLPDIYDLLGKLLFWTEKQRQRAAEIEMEIEAQMLHATPFGLLAVRQAREQGRTVCFVSDMYLDSHFLKKVLEREGIAQADDLVAVSGEWKASKAAKKIWPRLLEKLRISSWQLFHQGDHIHSDVDSPAALGISSRRIGTSVVSRWEQWSAKSSPLGVEEWGGIAALSRISRVSCENPDGYWTQLGAGILGPMITGFVGWLLDRVKADGISTLWFLSRDGWLFYQAALLYDHREGLDMQYIGISRNQLRFAQEGARPLEALFAGSRKITWGLVRERLVFSSQDMTQLFQSMKLMEPRMEQTISALEQSSLMALLRSNEWSKLRDRRAAEAGDATKAYLTQWAKGVGQIGVVDVGWLGRSQDMLKQLCPGVTHGYYLGLSHAQPHENKSAWLYDLGRKEGDIRLNAFQRMVETLVGSESGPLEGYECDNGSWQPRFSPINAKESTPGRCLMQQASLEFVKFSGHEAYRNWWNVDHLRVFTAHNLLCLLVSPDSRDLSSFREWRVTTDDAHQDTVSPAQGFDRHRLAKCLAKKEPWGMIWPQAAIANSRCIIRAGIKLAWKFKK
jgi:predicted HAD superfamily hydrolase